MNGFRTTAFNEVAAIVLGGTGCMMVNSQTRQTFLPVDSISRD